MSMQVKSVVLASRVAELTTTLEQHKADSLRAAEEYARETRGIQQ